MTFNDPFLLGDPRYLAGGATCTSSSTYDSGSVAQIIQGTSVLLNENCAGSRLKLVCTGSGQTVYGGICTYHGTHGAQHNIFIRADDPMPSAGVEIETVFRPDNDDGTHLNKVHDYLVSNWFHFEHDGSLPSRGHELVTEPLCSGIYRNLDTWIGLQNLMTPFATSFKNPETGLHVHVGTAAFRKLNKCAFGRLGSSSRNSLARLLLATVYYGVCGPDLLDAVFLRRASGYCAMKHPVCLGPALAAAKTGNVPFADLEDMVVACMVSNSTTALNSVVGDSDGFNCLGPTGEFNGHGSELNFPHRHTLEFRRGNGTLNGVSVHRMIEFCTLLVDYVRRCAENPDVKVSREALYEYIKSNTVSDALKDTIDRCNHKKEG